MEGGRQGHILVRQERDDKILEHERVSVPSLSSGNYWVTYPITPRDHVSDCRDSCLYFFAWPASLEDGRAKLALLIWTELVAVGPWPGSFAYFSAEQIQGIGQKEIISRVLKFACVNIFLLLYLEISWVCHHHLLVKVRHQPASGTIQHPCSLILWIQMCITLKAGAGWCRVMGKFTPEFTAFFLSLGKQALTHLNSLVPCSGQLSCSY